MAMYFASLFYQSMPQACVVDLISPVFSGISGLVSNPNGSLSASWSPATDSTNPIFYYVYIKKSTSTDLFNASNLLMITKNLNALIYADAEQNALIESMPYHVGVRAVDAVGNMETNQVSLSATSTGVASNSIFNQLNKILENLGSCSQIVGYADSDTQLVAVAQIDSCQDIIKGIVETDDIIV